MKNGIIVMGLVIVLLGAGCASMRWTEMDDGAMEEPSEKEVEYIRGTLDEAFLFEDFNDSDYAKGVKVYGEPSFDEGIVQIPKDGDWIEVNLEEPATRLITCYRITSDEGHILVSTNIPEGHTDIFNDVLGSWGHNMKGDTPKQRVDAAGFGNARTRDWIVQELRIENGELVFLKNNRSFGTVPLKNTEHFTGFKIRANVGGKGKVDWIAAD
jgi:hypothetical protein